MKKTSLIIKGTVVILLIICSIGAYSQSAKQRPDLKGQGQVKIKLNVLLGDRAIVTSGAGFDSWTCVPGGGICDIVSAGLTNGGGAAPDIGHINITGRAYADISRLIFSIDDDLATKTEFFPFKSEVLFDNKLSSKLGFKSIIVLPGLYKIDYSKSKKGVVTLSIKTTPFPKVQPNTDKKRNESVMKK